MKQALLVTLLACVSSSVFAQASYKCKKVGGEGFLGEDLKDLQKISIYINRHYKAQIRYSYSGLPNDPRSDFKLEERWTYFPRKGHYEFYLQSATSISDIAINRDTLMATLVSTGDGKVFFQCIND